MMSVVGDTVVIVHFKRITVGILRITIGARYFLSHNSTDRLIFLVELSVMELVDQGIFIIVDF